MARNIFKIILIVFLYSCSKSPEACETNLTGTVRFLNPAYQSRSIDYYTLKFPEDTLYPESIMLYLERELIFNEGSHNFVFSKGRDTTVLYDGSFTITHCETSYIFIEDFLPDSIPDF